MKRVKPTTITEFYEKAADLIGVEVESLLPTGLYREIGHFNVFDVFDTIQSVQQKHTMPYNRKAYYKISLIRGRNRTEYADKVIQVKNNALLFATPKVPYHWIPQNENLQGSFCVFTEEFMMKNKSGVILDELPIFQSGGFPVFEINDEKADELILIFNKMKKEIVSDYTFKYDLLRNYVLELIHEGQKLQPAPILRTTQNGTARIASLFIELLERQFPIESPTQRLQLRTATDYAKRLAIHINYLNKVLKESTGKTTTQLVGGRVVQEAKILLKQTNWSISEIGFSLGFEEASHFSNFFKKQVHASPIEFRVQAKN